MSNVSSNSHSISDQFYKAVSLHIIAIASFTVISNIHSYTNQKRLLLNITITYLSRNQIGLYQLHCRKTALTTQTTESSHSARKQQRLQN